MIYVAIDTCVWLELIKVDTSQAFNHFDELMFWLENRHATCITTSNMIAEWNRNKAQKKEFVLEIVKRLGSSASSVFSTATPLDTLYAPNIVEQKLSARIDRVDLLFSSIAEVASETDDIFIRAAKRSMDCIAPNHQKDSFRDTVNYMTLTDHLIKHDYPKSYFTTINYKDYSDPQVKFDLHPQLKPDFTRANLEYQFFDNSKGSFGGILMNSILRKSLPDYTKHLQSLKEAEQRQKIVDAEQEKVMRMDENDPDFLKYSQRIDEIAAKAEPDEVDQAVLEILYKKHPAYEKYFIRKLTENGMV